MQNQSLLYGLIGLLSGSLLTIIITNNAIQNQNFSMLRMMGMGQGVQMMQGSQDTVPLNQGADHMNMGSSMTDMMDLLEGATGDAFDAAFIEAMIVHHEGAIEMAEEAQVSAKHDEIKTLADDIITAQSKEIELMKSWKNQWGY